MATSVHAAKVACVIGNNRYQHSNPLNNAANDAADVGSVLERSGFTTISLKDASQAEMHSGLQVFKSKAHGADVCVFFFAGHGFEIGKKNYLVPVDGRLQGAVKPGASMIPLQDVLGVIRDTRAKLKIVVLDCCRNNPFDTVSGGLAPIPEADFPAGTLIVYSGAPGQTVPDGVNTRNSPFSEELLRQLKPKRDVLSLFASVAAVRYKAQDPWIKFDGSGATFALLRAYDLLSHHGKERGLKVVASEQKKQFRISSYWDHNGSTVGLLVRGDERVLIYVKVRRGLLGYVQPGTVLFRGKSIGGNYSGKARRFSKGLSPVEYEVSGPILGNGNKVVLTGSAPIRNPDGLVKKVINDRLEFSYMKLVD